MAASIYVGCFLLLLEVDIEACVTVFWYILSLIIWNLPFCNPNWYQVHRILYHTNTQRFGNTLRGLPWDVVHIICQYIAHKSRQQQVQPWWDATYGAIDQGFLRLGNIPICRILRREPCWIIFQLVEVCKQLFKFWCITIHFLFSKKNYICWWIMVGHRQCRCRGIHIYQEECWDISYLCPFSRRCRSRWIQCC